MPLDPIIATAEQAAAELLGEGGADLSPEAWRALAWRVEEQVVAPHVADPPEVGIRDVVVPVPGRSDVSVRLYLPAPPARGIYLFFFGGAFRQGGVDFPSVDAELRARAAEARIIVAAPAYALAPEAPYPAAVEQALAVLRWLREHAGGFDTTRDDVTIGGMSAGANIAAATTLLARDAGIPIRQQILEVPVLDLTGESLDPAAGALLGISDVDLPAMLTPIADVYLAGADPRSATASPLLAPDLSGLPPAHVLTAEYDILRGDGAAYVEALRRHGTPATEYRFDGITHGGLAFTRSVPAAQQWHRTVTRLLSE